MVFYIQLLGSWFRTLGFRVCWCSMFSFWVPGLGQDLGVSSFVGTCVCVCAFTFCGPTGYTSLFTPSWGILLGETKLYSFSTHVYSCSIQKMPDLAIKV